MFCLPHLARALAILFFSFVLLNPYVYGNETTSCYKIEVKNSPAREFPIDVQTEVWCYQFLKNSNKLFIYNSDPGKVKPELSMLIDSDGTITHASLLNGKLSMHRVLQQDFNPLSIPLRPPQDQFPIVNLRSFNISDQSVQKFFLQADALKIESFSIMDTQNLIASASILPWRGSWWPRKNIPMRGPLMKYDRYVQARTGTNPGTASWERKNHAYRGVSWSGHCNGWAASAIIHAEPRLQKTDPVSGTIFTVSDQKGILAEADYCIRAAFFGKRNYGGGNNGDIRPELFHKTLLYYIGSLGKPIVIDYRSDSSVDNHIVSGYVMSIIPAGENRYNVTATLSMHGYDSVPSDLPGVALPYTRVYKYTLLTDDQAKPIGGSWLSDNPDFMWAPLSPINCQNLNYDHINSILNL